MILRPMPCQTAARIVLTGATLALLSGCVGYRVYEIDAAGLQRFNWSGKILIVERSSPEIGPFLTFSHRTEMYRVELVGDRDRNVVIVQERGGRLLAKVQDVGRPPDRILAALIQDNPVLKKMAENALELASLPEKDLEAFGELLSEYFQTSGHLQNREFSDVTGKQVAFACAGSPEMQVETIYRFNRDTLVRVHLTDGKMRTVRPCIDMNPKSWRWLKFPPAESSGEAALPWVFSCLGLRNDRS